MFFAKFTVLTEEDSDHILCKFDCNVWLHLKIITIWTWMYIFKVNK